MSSARSGQNTLVVHATSPGSRANGPGNRFVVWVQGCSLGCAGCFNPTTHEAGTVPETPVSEIVEAMVGAGDSIEGVTISGGEPLEQPEGVLALLDQLRGAAPQLSVLLFSGFTHQEIEAMPLGPAILSRLDVLIDGRYQAPQRIGRNLQGSANQRILLLSDRYSEAQVRNTPEAEVRIQPDGTLIMTGVAPFRID